MTRYTACQLMLLATGAMAIPAGIAGIRPISVEVDPDVSPVTRVTNADPAPPLDSLVRHVVDHDAFRVTRAPSAVAYNPSPPEAVPVEAPPPKPQLTLTGIVWGRDPAAIVEGLPGVEGGRLVRPGESIGGVRVRRITEHDVTLAGMDTTWVLQVRKPW